MLGYTVSRMAGLQERQARTNSIEVRAHSDPAFMSDCLHGRLLSSLYTMLQAVHHVMDVSKVPVCSHHSQLPQRPKAGIMPVQS